MQKPLELTFRNMPQSRAMTELVHDKVEKLEKICDYITSCLVVIDKPQAHQQAGNPYQVLVEVRVPPGHVLVVRREPTEHEMHENLGTVLRDAFEALHRQVRAIVQRQHEKAKAHPQREMTAVVQELDEEEGFGFLETPDGRRVHFARSSVAHGGFARLEIGAEVSFVEAVGADGPRAATVQVIDAPAVNTAGTRTPNAD